jgi:phosphohistidine phosphatase SixA
VRAIYCVCLVLVPMAARGEDPAAVRALRDGGIAVLMRHAQTTPGVGDPPGWRPDDCSTQRNLNAEGRAHARRIGNWFRRQHVAPTVVRSSPWCRARDTARLAFGGAEDWPALANLFEDRGPEKRNVEEVRRYIAGLRKGEVAVLVSHGSSIAAFVGEHPAPGEGIVVRAAPSADGEAQLVVVGRIVVP